MQVPCEGGEDYRHKKSRDWAKYIASGEFHFSSSEQESGVPPESIMIMLAGEVSCKILKQNEFRAKRREYES
jgi:hypothetical protein